MKTYEETIRTVLEQRDEILAKKELKNKRLKKTLLPLGCSLVLALAATALWRGGVLQNTVIRPPEAPAVTDGTGRPAQYGGPGSEQQPTDVRGPADTQSPTDVQSPTGAQDSTAAPDVTDGDGPSGGEIGYYSIPTLPRDREIVAVGEKITDEEAAAYFAQRRGSLAQSLGASGVAADNITISEKGYCHVCYSGSEGEKLEVRENFRDYLVYNGEALVAIVTLYKEDGKLYDTPAFGAAWFADYAAFLRQHAGEALVYVYAGFAELIITPEGGVYSPLPSVRAAAYTAGTEDPYRTFYHPGAVYVP